MRRPSFLTVFLSCLTVAFAIAVYFRLRSYRTSTDLSGAPSTVTTATHPQAAAQPMVTTGTVAPRQTATTTRTTSKREQLRERLLREPIPVAKPAAPRPTSTATPSRPTAATATAPIQKPLTPPPPRASTLQPPVHQPPSSPPSKAADAAAKPKDPNSDTTPPQLISLEFDPPQIHDGEESRVVMVATDDMSGIRGISGTIASPNGKALLGFAGTREGDTNRYIGRVQVPKNADEGLWRVNVVTMSDNASNSVTMTTAQGSLRITAALRVVSSQADSTPPVLKSARAERRAMNAGEPNPIHIEAEDDNSGVNLVSAVFQSPNKRARVGAGCRHGEGDEWLCELSMPSCIDCGDWQLEQVTLQDKANNLATYRLDNPIVAAVKINIGGSSCDSEAPRLQSAFVDPPVVNLAREAAVVVVTIHATDDACGVEGASGQFMGPGTGTSGFFPFQKVDETTWVGRIPLDPRAPRGTWRITSVQLTDKGHNLRMYSGNDPLLANATFEVR